MSPNNCLRPSLNSCTEKYLFTTGLYLLIIWLLKAIVWVGFYFRNNEINYSFIFSFFENYPLLKMYTLACLCLSHKIIVKNITVYGCNLKKDEKLQVMNTFAGHCMCCYSHRFSQLIYRCHKCIPFANLFLSRQINERWKPPIHNRRGKKDKTHTLKIISN